ncbi:hypothetical protein Egran_03161 [Elaphomyces granulatus]|uniref:Uncharacterized protein n=1 Tax=Elaphomyces granulatus TaxID=519963 RepID=A0A232LYB0_9EURO|nr:hypothetical protein Egran_03161 [Elaphomyces granulatus]
MVDKARQVRPDAKWYVFMEADMYLIWPNLVAWLARQDSKKPRYFDNPVQISDVIFAHGGPGIVLSSPAMQLVSDRYASYVEEINSFTAEQWAGDCIMASRDDWDNMSLEKPADGEDSRPSLKSIAEWEAVVKEFAQAG